MTFEEKYGYTLYGKDDPQMQIFWKAIDYLGIDKWNRTNCFNAVKKVLISNDWLDGDIWKNLDFDTLFQYYRASSGPKSRAIILVAQMIDKGDINI